MIALHAEASYREGTFHCKSSGGEVESVVKGFAADSTTGAGTTLMVAALRLEFENGALLNCKQ